MAPAEAWRRPGNRREAAARHLIMQRVPGNCTVALSDNHSSCRELNTSPDDDYEAI